MATVSYIVRSNKKGNSEVSIWVLVRSTTLNTKVSTKIKVPFNLWDAKRQCLKPYKSNTQSLIDRLDKVGADLIDLRDYVLALLSGDESICGTQLKTQILKRLGDVKEVKQNGNIRFIDYLNLQIEKIRNGEILRKGNRLSSETLRSRLSFAKTWTKFQTDYLKMNLYLKDIDMYVYTSFINYCNSQKFTASTVKLYITYVKWVMNLAYSEKVTTNTIHTDKNFTSNIASADVDKIYLTDTEIDMLFGFDLQDDLQYKVRDVFLIGCYCGQRVSDYTNISKDNIRVLSDGSKAFDLIQQKTKKRVIVPFLSSNIDVILERWNYQLPQLSPIVINREIKNICRLAKINSLSSEEIIKGGKLEKTIKEKWELVTTHTARRSAITNLYKGGKLDSTELRSISGHKTDTSFNRYICLSDIEQAEKIAKKLNDKAGNVKVG